MVYNVMQFEYVLKYDHSVKDTVHYNDNHCVSVIRDIKSYSMEMAILSTSSMLPKMAHLI